MNVSKYPWLLDLRSTAAAKEEISRAREEFDRTGAVVFHDFITEEFLAECVRDARAQEDAAFTTNDSHNAYLKPVDLERFPKGSVYNHEMKTHVASIAFDELPKGSKLAELYRNPILLELVSLILRKPLYLSEDPLGCCSVNVFRPSYHHSFHFDESEFSTTLMLQEAETEGTGLFQYTHPLRDSSEELVLSDAASVIDCYAKSPNTDVGFTELKEKSGESGDQPPKLHTLDFRPGTLSIFSGSRSLHRVTTVEGHQSRLVAVLTFAGQPGFCNSEAVQKLFWGRTSHQRLQQQ